LTERYLGMERSYIEDLAGHVGGEVEVKGWVYHLRSSGKIRFVVLRDGTGLVQCIVTEEESPEAFEIFPRLVQETSCSVTGLVREDKRAPGGYEILARGIRVIQDSEPYPITPKEHGVAFLLEQRHLWLRSSKQSAILRIRAEVEKACRDFLDQRGFVAVDSPILTPSAAEETTTLFEVDYFGSKVYLSQSGQLYNEASAMALGRVYCFGPTFRAEKAKTRRHLTEFWMLEPEIAFGDLDTVFELSEGMTMAVIEQVLARRRRELDVLERDVTKLERIRGPFSKITYTEAVEILKRKGFDMEFGDPLGADEETALSLDFDRPVFIHRYPAATKAFYMQPDPEDPRLAMCTDMLAPEGYGEIIGGSERIYDKDLIEARIREFGVPMDSFRWYLDLRRYGSVPHSGFGLGIERTVGWICGLHHIRETIPFPRMIYRVYP
jgi:asparaginyl-tRNA synthetase